MARSTDRPGVVARTIDGYSPIKARPAFPWDAARADEDYGAPATPDWRETDWSEHVRDVEIAGRRVRYVELGAGDGPPVVFVHGLGGNWQNWLENLPRIARERRVLALDLPGFGVSEAPEGEISISGYAHLVDAWCERLDVGALAVVGNSMGGFIGAELAIAFPERVERLVLVSAAGISHADMRRRPLVTVARRSAALTALTAAAVEGAVVRPRLRHLILAAVALHPTRLRADIVYELLRGAGSPSWPDALEALISYDFRDRLPEVDCPTFIVWGEDDALVPVRDADEYERRIPTVRKTILEDTGHIPMVERPDAFNRLLVEFLKEAAQGSGPAGNFDQSAATPS